MIKAVIIAKPIIPGVIRRITERHELDTSGPVGCPGLSTQVFACYRAKRACREDQPWVRGNSDPFALPEWGMRAVVRKVIRGMSQGEDS